MKKTVSFFTVICLLLLMLPSVYAEEVKTHPSRLVDESGVLSSSEYSQIIAKLDEISERQQCDVCVFITDLSIDGNSKVFADTLYDMGGYGMGDNNDGMLLVISMTSRDWYVTTTGFGMTAITEAGLEYISDKFVPYLSDGDYAKGINTYASLCDDFITQAKSGEPYDVGNMPKDPLKLILFGVIALVIGIVTAFIIVTVMKRQLKSIKMATGATDYVRSGSFLLTNSKDLFLYKDLKMIPLPKDTGGRSGGGFSGGGFSGGGSHGGGGGKF